MLWQNLGYLYSNPIRSFHQQWIDDNISVSQGDGSSRKGTYFISQAITWTHTNEEGENLLYPWNENLTLLGGKRGWQSFVGVKMKIEEFIKEMEEQDMTRKVQSWESSLESMLLQSVWSRVPEQVALT